ncbi:MAG: aminotransferase class V-fold PLP-dependent enzyme [Thermoanaerobaculia bacterium]
MSRPNRRRSEPREQFQALGERVWLNTAHQGVLPDAAAEAARAAVAWKQRPWELTQERFSGVPGALRSTLARLLGAPEEEVVLANSSSYGLHLLANGFPWRSGDEVLLVRGDFPSTILPWLGLERRGVAVRFLEPRGPAVTAEEVAAHLGPRTRVLCTTWVHSFTGHAIDERAVGEACRARGVRFVLNASQGVGARPLPVADLPLDAVTGVGFKWLCGPYGTGFCWVRSELLAQLEHNQLYWLAFQTAGDLEGGGPDGPPDEGPGAPRQSPAGAGPAVDPDRVRELGARRYDVFGTANFFNFSAWTAALEVVLDHGVEAIAAHDQALVERLIAGLDEGRFELTSPREGPERSTLVFLTHRDPAENRAVHRRLRDAGVHCALRRGRLRLSPHLYNTPEDVDRALEVLHR